MIERLQNGGMRVALFVDADPAVAALAAEVGADRVESSPAPMAIRALTRRPNWRD